MRAQTLSRLVMAILVIAVAASTMTIYAASISGTSKRLGGTGDVTVTGPTSAAGAVLSTWNLDSAGKVDTVVVSWTPSVSSNYSVYVLLKSSTTTLGSGQAVVSNSGTSLNNTTVDIGATTVDPMDVATVVVNIVET